MLSYKYTKRTLYYRLIVFGIICLALFVLPITVILTTSGTNAFAPLIYVMCALIILICFVFTVLYAIFGYKIFKFDLSGGALSITKGFIFKKQCFLPAAKIKGVNILTKRLIYKDLVTVVVLNDSGDVKIKDIDKATAEKLVLALKGKDYEKSI